MKATASAHPTQPLIGEGFFDRVNLPFHDSISVCTAPVRAVATFEFTEEKEVLINGKVPDALHLSRIDSVVAEIKRMSKVDDEYTLWVRSDFPAIEGLGFSSEIAALTAACAQAAGLDLSRKELSQIAHRGGEAASKAVTGWFSRWKTSMDLQFCYSSVIEDELEMGMIQAVVEPSGIGNGIHTEGLSSPFVEYWLQSMHTSLYNMERAIRDRDIEKIGALAERDSMVLHALSVTGTELLLSWAPDTLRVMAEVKTLRDEGVNAHFNCGRGPSVYINFYPEDAVLIEERMKKLGVTPIRLSVGSGVCLLSEHLF